MDTLQKQQKHTQNSRKFETPRKQQKNGNTQKTSPKTADKCKHQENSKNKIKNTEKTTRYAEQIYTSSQNSNFLQQNIENLTDIL